MKAKEKYVIAYTGLKNGKHDFHFEVADSFWEEHEGSSIAHSSLDVDVDLEKHSTMLVLNVFISGLVEMPCDRCLEDFNLYIEADNKLIVKFGEETYEESEEILVLARSEAEVNLRQYIYEYVHTALPMRIIHPDNADGSSQCNADVLKKIEELSVQELPMQDPRWNKLKNITEN